MRASPMRGNSPQWAMTFRSIHPFIVPVQRGLPAASGLKARAFWGPCLSANHSVPTQTLEHRSGTGALEWRIFPGRSFRPEFGCGNQYHRVFLQEVYAEVVDAMTVARCVHSDAYETRQYHLPSRRCGTNRLSPNTTSGGPVQSPDDLRLPYSCSSDAAWTSMSLRFGLHRPHQLKAVHCPATTRVMVRQSLSLILTAKLLSVQ